MSNDDNENKQIEVITGDDSELDVSPVYDHLNGVTPKTVEGEKKNIIIPGVKEEDNNEEDDEKKSNE